jgi:quinol monooxygenase YgiN
MILVMIRMDVLPEKRKELSQAISSLLGSIRKEKGCHRCDFCNRLEDENEFFLIEEWGTKGDLASHLRSELFQVVLGAMNLLKKPQEMRFYTDLSISQSANWRGELNLS